MYGNWKWNLELYGGNWEKLLKLMDCLYSERTNLLYKNWMGKTQIEYCFQKKGLGGCLGLWDNHKSFLGYDNKIGLGHKKGSLEIIFQLRMDSVQFGKLCFEKDVEELLKASEWCGLRVTDEWIGVVYARKENARRWYDSSLQVWKIQL